MHDEKSSYRPSPRRRIKDRGVVSARGEFLRVVRTIRYRPSDEGYGLTYGPFQKRRVLSKMD